MNLRELFDFNTIASNAALDAMIQDTLGRYGACDRMELDDDDLDWVNAAGSDAMQYDFDEKED
ncbi:MAG: hypothetical protein Q4E53_05265 [Eubacteriales bacterium]|nr:hypothetical protein [Eubacteriales bacterium]